MDKHGIVKLRITIAEMQGKDNGMTKLKEWLFNFKPPFVLSCVLTVLFGAGSLFAAAADFGKIISPVIVYVLYAGAAIFLSLSIWAIVLFFRKVSPKQQLLAAAGKNSFTAKLAQDYSYRTMMVTSGSLTINVLLAASKMFAGWYYVSTWLMVLSGYYMILCLSKFLLLRYGRKQAALTDKKAALIHEWNAYRLCGIMFLVLTVFLQGVVIMIVRDGMGFSYHAIVVIGMAAYDFYCLTGAIIYIVKKRKSHSPMTNALKSISFASTLVAMLSLQTAMFSAFGTGADGAIKPLMNILTGTVVCALLIILGIRMIARSNNEMKQIVALDMKAEEAK